MSEPTPVYNLKEDRMIKESVSIDQAILLLNELLELDRPAMAALVANRVPCNRALADHPTVPCATQHGGFHFGMLGVINGLFGVNENGRSAIQSVWDDDPSGYGLQLVRFERMPDLDRQDDEGEV